ncbi:MAG TPA: TylF/MycF/NovP-related O-methyltransferase [Bacteroidota bacterium]|nr:TylF/MycF/NovP-related O-methyltransferase [Bacteroidota bacterium]
MQQSSELPRNLTAQNSGGSATGQVRGVGADLSSGVLPPQAVLKSAPVAAKLDAAVAHAAAGRAAEALAIYRELFSADPDNCAVLNGLGYLCLQLNDAGTAAQFFNRVLALEPTDMRASRALQSIAGHRRRSPDGPAQGTVITRVVRPAAYWDTDPGFGGLLKQIPYTLVDPVRCYMLYQCALQAARLGADAAEVGVYRGGTARLIASALRGSPARVHLFDTFEGMPATDPSKDEHRQGDFSDTSLESVQRNLAGLDNVAFYPGFFPATAPPVESMQFALAHIDVDIYRSVLDCCGFFYPRMVPGGMMVFDDYGFDTCPGAKQGVDEFFSGTPERPMYLPSGQCLVVKLPDGRLPVAPQGTLAVGDAVIASGAAGAAKQSRA